MSQQMIVFCALKCGEIILVPLVWYLLSLQGRFLGRYWGPGNVDEWDWQERWILAPFLYGLSLWVAVVAFVFINWHWAGAIVSDG